MGKLIAGLQVALCAACEEQVPLCAACEEQVPLCAACEEQLPLKPTCARATKKFCCHVLKNGEGRGFSVPCSLIQSKYV